jgi:hypothetical protein
MAARLEAASRQYGVTILVSEAFYALLSPRVKACASLAPLYAVVRIPRRNVLDRGVLCCNKAWLGCDVEWSGVGAPRVRRWIGQHCCAVPAAAARVDLLVVLCLRLCRGRCSAG